MVERRMGRRYDLSFPVRIHQPESFQTGCTRDISRHGLYVITSGDITIGDRVKFIVTLLAETAAKQKVSVRVSARVVRIDKPHSEERASMGVAAAIEGYDIFRGDLPID